MVRMIDIPLEQFRFVCTLNKVYFENSLKGRILSVKDLAKYTGYSKRQIYRLKPWLIEEKVLKDSGNRFTDDELTRNEQVFTIQICAISYLLFIKWETSSLHEAAHEFVLRDDIIDEYERI